MLQATVYLIGMLLSGSCSMFSVESTLPAGVTMTEKTTAHHIDYNTLFAVVFDSQALCQQKVFVIH
jgi:hypothetical protein